MSIETLSAAIPSSFESIATAGASINDALIYNGSTWTPLDTAISLADLLFKIGAGNTAGDTKDLGIYFPYNSSGVKYGAFFRDATDSTFKVLNGITAEPVSDVITFSNNYAKFNCGDLKIHNTAAESKSVLLNVDSNGYLTIAPSGLSTTITGAVTVSGRMKQSKGANVTATSPLILGSDGNTFTVTGITPITSIATTGWSAGSIIDLIFTGVGLPMIYSASLMLAGDEDFYVKTSGDTMRLLFDGTNWIELSRGITNLPCEIYQVFNNDHYATISVSQTGQYVISPSGGEISLDASTVFMAYGKQLLVGTTNTASLSGFVPIAYFWQFTANPTGLVVENFRNIGGVGDCKIEMNVGGANGGDPHIVFNNYNVGGYAVGLDNSQNDRFQICYGVPPAIGVGVLLSSSTTGDWGMGLTAAQASNARLELVKTTEQLRLTHTYDSDVPANYKYTSFIVNSSGNLTVVPNGGNTSITGALNVSTALAVTGQTALATSLTGIAKMASGVVSGSAASPDLTDYTSQSSNITFSGIWADQTVSVYLTKIANKVTISFKVEANATAIAPISFTLPSGYRPSGTIKLSCMTLNDGVYAMSRINIASNGVSTINASLGTANFLGTSTVGASGAECHGTFDARS